MNISFRNATITDIPLITKLADKIWRIHYINIISLQQIDYMLEKMYSTEKLLAEMKQGYLFTLVFVNEKPIGYISISTNDNKKYILHKFYIEIDNHRKGVGSHLFSEAIKRLNAPETIQLTVNRKNYKAINFYFKNGFVIKDLADIDIGNGFFMNDFIMEKHIS